MLIEKIDIPRVIGSPDRRILIAGKVYSPGRVTMKFERSSAENA